MGKKFRIITNNPLVEKELGQNNTVEYYDVSYEEILKKVRDQVYANCKLLSHPLSGSVKPNETPYKSVMVSAIPDKLDFQSVEIIEEAVGACGKFEKKWERYQFDGKVFEDFQLIDYTLISSAVQSAEYI